MTTPAGIHDAAGRPISRPYAGPSDLAPMQAALSASWRLARPWSNTTPGDLEWWQALAGPDVDWTERIRIWELGGQVVAYGWFLPSTDVDWHQRADLPDPLRAAIVAETLDWAVERAVAFGAPAVADTDAPAAASGTGSDAPAGQTPPVLRTWAMDADDGLGALLTAHGFEAAPEPQYVHWVRRLGEPPPAPTLPEGYTLRHVRLPEDLEARVDVHRAAFAPSQLTLAKYEALVRMAHYDRTRDLVVEAPDGSLAAFALVWWDPAARMGEFEPVGTHPAHRGLGLARALLHAGQGLLRDLGAADALVLSETGNPAAGGLYASAGFEAVTVHRAWTRALG